VNPCPLPCPEPINQVSAHRICPRLVPVAESIMALVLADPCLRQRALRARAR